VQTSQFAHASAPAAAHGLDPEESVAAARYQAARAARVRSLPEARLRALIATHTEGSLLSRASTFWS